MKNLSEETFLEIREGFPSDVVVLMGNGKSLTQERLKKIFNTNFPVFAVNRFYLSFDKTLRLPDFYAISDRAIIVKKMPAELDDIKYKFIPSRFKESVKDDFICVNHISRNDPAYDRVFSETPSEVTYGGYTVIFFALQILFKSHFKTILLIGCDNNYDLTMYKKADKETPNGKGVIFDSEKSNHFVNNYFSPGELITDVYPDEQNRSFSLARHAFRKSGQELICLSEISTIPIPKQKFDGWF